MSPEKPNKKLAFEILAETLSSGYVLTRLEIEEHFQQYGFGANYSLSTPRRKEMFTQATGVIVAQISVRGPHHSPTLVYLDSLLSLEDTDFNDAVKRLRNRANLNDI